MATILSEVQIKRNISGTPVAAPTLLDGELAYASGGFLPGGGPDELIIGNGGTPELLISKNRQVETTGNQTVASGTKQFAAGAKLLIGSADFKLGGGVNEAVLSTDGAGNLVWVARTAVGGAADGDTIISNPDGSLSVNVVALPDGKTIILDANQKLAVNKADATDLDVARSNAFVDALQLTNGVLGGKLSTLATTAKTIIPAINELRSQAAALTGTIIFAGTLDASTGDITPASNVANVPANIADVNPALTKNYFWIVTTGGSNVGPGNVKPVQPQDWVASDGAKVVSLNYGAQPVTAANVSYLPGANEFITATNVQAALDQVEACLHGPIDAGEF